MEMVMIGHIGKDAGQNIYLFQCPKCKDIWIGDANKIKCSCEVQTKMVLSGAIVRELIDDIRERKGFRQLWDSLDVEIQEEIRETWTNIINKYIKKKVM